MNLKNRKYIFYQGKVEFYEGFLVIDRKMVNYDKVTDCILRKGIFDRWFGTGTISLLTAGFDPRGNISGWRGSGIKMETIRNVEIVYTKLQKLLRKNKMKTTFICLIVILVLFVSGCTPIPKTSLEECEKITDELTKYDCYSIVATESNDASLCEQIPVVDYQSESTKIRCYSSLAVENDDLSFCDNLAGNMQHFPFSNKERCYKEVSTSCSDKKLMMKYSENVELPSICQTVA